MTLIKIIKSFLHFNWDLVLFAGLHKVTDPPVNYDYLFICDLKWDLLQFFEIYAPPLNVFLDIVIPPPPASSNINSKYMRDLTEDKADLPF